MDIFVGSLTGTAQRLAIALAAKAQQRGVTVSLESLQSFDATRFRDATATRVTVFVVATHFAGGPSPNAETFAQWLRGATDVCRYPKAVADPLDASPQYEPNPMPAGTRLRRNRVNPAEPTAPRRHSSPPQMIPPSALQHTSWWFPFGGGGSGTATSSSSSETRSIKPKNPFLGTQYAVFGVGSSEYLTYNAMGKFVDARLKILGAERLCSLGLGDVANGLDGAFAKWEAKLLALLPIRVAGPTIKSARSTEIEEEADGKSTRRHSVDCGPTVAALDSVSFSKHRRQAAPRRYSGVFDLIRKRRSTLPCPPSVVKAESDAPTKVPAKTDTIFVVQDRYGRSMRLHYCCRYVSQEEPVANTLANDDTSVATGRLKSFRAMRDATHVRRSTIAIKSLTILNDSHMSDENAVVANEVALARMELRDPCMSFETTDTLGYFPPNAPEIVTAVGQGFGLNLDASVEFTTPGAATADGTERQLPFPGRCTVRTVLSDFLELRTVSREFVRVASGFVTDQQEHEHLENLVAIDSSANFTREFGQAPWGMLKLLELAPSLRVTFEVLVNITPLIKPRLYSIASSHLHNEREFDVFVTLGGPHGPAQGLSVSHFRRLLARSDVVDASWNPPPLLRGFVSSSLFKPPPKLSAPMVLIAENMAFAPLRALLQHRSLERGEKRVDGEKAVCGKMLLLLGWSTSPCVLFESELREWEAQGLVEVHVHSASESTQCMQELATACKPQVVALMSDSSDAQLYVCGAATVVKSVQQVLTAPKQEDATTDWYTLAIESGRYLQRVVA